VLVDWFTVAAQIVNFLILVLLLKHFLYGRIIKAMDERESSIASRIQEAEKKSREAGKELEEYQKRNRDMEKKREEVLSEAHRDAESKKEELLQEAEKDARNEQKKWQEAVRNDKDRYMREMKQRTAHQFFSLARKALKDLADADLEKQIVNTFTRKIRELDGRKRKEITEKLEQGEAEISVLTSLPLSESSEKNVRQALEETFNKSENIRFRHSPETVSGIEVRIDGYKIDWSLDRYLESMESEMAKGYPDRPRQKEEKSGKHNGEAEK
jgi:F-type H+-transporting ATPase subunit b